MAKKKSVWQNIKSSISKKSVARLIYLVSMTVVTTGLMMAVLLAISILMPHLKCGSYIKTSCITNGSRYYPTGSGSKPSTLWPECTTPAMKYPCVQVFVNYTLKNTTKLIFAMLHENEYNLLESEAETKKNCSFSRCTISTKENTQQIDSMLKIHGNRDQKFSCLYDPNDHSRVIINYYHNQRQALLSVAIPAGFAAFSLLLTVISLLTVGCDVWGHHVPATASWERSISVLELEAAKSQPVTAQNSLYGQKDMNAWHFNNLNDVSSMNIPPNSGLTSSEKCQH